ncbi:hypothetical protein GALL_445830 [mine drainage metagenome]|uniref:Uncharacterized protein n=1 Tax=mine drainage metagenome TaxID=410659 RepID=A0A1J5PQJ8_9ZZZZ
MSAMSAAVRDCCRTTAMASAKPSKKSTLSLRSWTRVPKALRQMGHPVNAIKSIDAAGPATGPNTSATPAQASDLNGCAVATADVT